MEYDVSDSLTGQVIIDRNPVLLNTEEILERKAQNRIHGTVPLVWLGVPLITDEKVIGVLAVQSYTNADLFDINDVKVLASVSDQVALAIDRKRTHQALVRNESRFREIADLLPTILCELDTDYTITYFNRVGVEIFGFDPVRLSSKQPAEIKTLKGILPICSSRKKIRDDQGYWNQVESYIRAHSQAEFSHSICQECAQKLYPEYDLHGE